MKWIFWNATSVNYNVVERDILHYSYASFFIVSTLNERKVARIASRKCVNTSHEIIIFQGITYNKNSTALKLHITAQE